MKKFTIITIFIITASFLFGQVSLNNLDSNEKVNKQNNPRSEFEKQPYLIFEGINTQMQVIWQLNETTTCEIYWGEDSTYNLGNANTTEYGDDHQHAYTITGLIADSKYYYKVISTSTIHEATFRTAALDTQTDLNFFMFGDTRTQFMVQDDVSAAMISDYQADSTFQTISICTGDLVKYGAYEPKWQTEFFTELGQNTLQRLAEIPFVSCIGNHELYHNNYLGIDTTTALFGKYFPYPFVERRYWSFDYGPVHFTLIDLYPGNYDLYGQGLIDDEQLEWIEDDLNTTSKDWKIVVLHEPGWSAGGSSSGYPHPNNEDVQNLLQPLFEQYGVQLVLGGHNHYYARAFKNGILHLTAAGGGAPLYYPDPGYTNLMKTCKTHHYCKASINDTSLLITVLTPVGDTVDEISILQNYLPSHLLGFISKEEGPGNISDVVIEVDGNIIHPDSIGYYGLELEQGTYDVTFTLPNYYPINQQVEIIPGTETQLDIMFLITGIPDIESEVNQFSISPNPISDFANLTLYKTIDEAISVSIYNLNGICMKRWQFHKKQAGQKKLELNLSDLPAGIYFCKIKSENKMLVKKIIKK